MRASGAAHICLFRILGKMKGPDYYGFPNGRLDFSYVLLATSWNGLTTTICAIFGLPLARAASLERLKRQSSSSL
ncbi:MAG: hypothetical protein EBR81_17140, partial [Proteobacteria bacterium]|nr:hypothetical protein [Pseudomonadota bacterium]